LVVDIGSGMGVSLLGLATYDRSKDDNNTTDSLLSYIEYNKCNYIGCDFNTLLLRYSQSITKRWYLQDRLQFIDMSAQELLDQLSCTNVTTKLIMIQFPTPFSIKQQDDKSANTYNKQLPANTSQFMVTTKLLRTAYNILKSNNENEGYLLLQSNCEDIAIYMKNIATQEAGFICIDNIQYPKAEEQPVATSRRTKLWIDSSIKSDDNERAFGPSWSSMPFLPSKGQTETEVACTLQSTPIHRCLLKPSI